MAKATKSCNENTVEMSHFLLSLGIARLLSKRIVRKEMLPNGETKMIAVVVLVGLELRQVVAS
jgi:hypothetical protein